MEANESRSAMNLSIPKAARGFVFGFLLAIIVGLLAGAYKANAQNAPSKRPDAANSERSLSDGRQIFEGRCAGCHGLDGRGGERAPDIATRPAVLQRTDAKLYEIIKGGLPATGMPAFPSLDDGSTKSLIAYVRFLQGKGPATTIPGNARNGEALFFGKARCSECHTIGGNGGFIASDLSAYGRGRAGSEIREAITNPKGDTRANTVLLVTTRSGNRLSGVVRNEDNFSLQLQSLDGSFHLLQKSEVASTARRPDSLMPSNYASTLSSQELDDLVGFLMTTANKEHAATAKRNDEEDEEDE